MKTLRSLPWLPTRFWVLVPLALAVGTGPFSLAAPAAARAWRPVPQVPRAPPITGRVTDEKGEPLPGANVVVKGTAQGTATNADGNYSIPAPAGATLVFSFVGYSTQEVPLAGRSTLDVRFAAPNAQTLNDVVVVGYGTQNRREVTGAIASVKGEELPGFAKPGQLAAGQGGGRAD
ncbi:MAG: carboxypeptidase-like regulatory domain-containing protein [Janthinobacterium lividum]